MKKNVIMRVVKTARCDWTNAGKWISGIMILSGGSSLKKILLHTNIALLLLASALFAAPYDDSGGFRTAARLINNGQYLEAVGIYNEISGTADSLDNRARALLFSGSVYDVYLEQPVVALKIFKEIYHKYPDSPASSDALFNSGRILYTMDKHREASDIFRVYMEKYPEAMRRNSAKIWEAKAKKNSLKLPEKHSPKMVNFPLETMIRVLLKKNVARLVFNSPSKIKITHVDTGKILFLGAGPVVISKKSSMIVINTEKTSAKKCKIETANEFISIGGQRYRGSFVVHGRLRGLTAVNHLHIEKYLYGVVPKEMSWLWPVEALMAQAIASRTYALYIRSKQPENRIYDLVSTTASQVYGGYNAEKERATRAVDDTFGKIMLFDGKLIIAYFHANSGGYTESSTNVWGADVPYLKSVADQFSSLPSTRKWSLSLSYGELETLLRSSRLNIGKIEQIQFEGRSKSGRIKSFVIVSDKGKTNLSGNNFRLKVGAASLKSTWFDTKTGKSGIVFKGRGYGHGVGMSQWGAHQMALADYSHDTILKHYYQGIEIARAVYK